MANPCKIMIPTNKRNQNREIIYVPVEINLNYDCWEHICDQMEWYQWAEICTANPQFKRFYNKLGEKLLHIKSNTYLNNILLNHLHLAKRVIIEDEQSTRRYYILRQYEGLTSVEDLTILNAVGRINYIKSRKIIKLKVTLGRQILVPGQPIPDINDCIEPILQHSTNIKELIYHNGDLSNNSIRRLMLNPIKKLFLMNIEPETPILASRLFLRSTHLTELSITGKCSFYMQNALLISKAIAQRLERLHIHLIKDIESDQYGLLKKFTNLKFLRVSYDRYEAMEDLYLHLQRLENLKQIELIPDLTHINPEQEAIRKNNDNNLFIGFKSIFNRQGTQITRIEQTDFTYLRKYSNDPDF